jgi:RHS repeat-associated protein
MFFSAASNLMNQITSKERDAETGLDYFLARYYSGAQGRFISPDPMGGKIANPQSFNRYAYVLNNPLKFTDPTGLYECLGSDRQCSGLEKTLKHQRDSRDDEIARSAASYGEAHTNNGVTVSFKDLSKKRIGGETETTFTFENGKLQAQSLITLDSKLAGAQFDAAVAEEGSHAADGKQVVDSGLVEMGGKIFANENITPYQSEQTGYRVTSKILAIGNTSLPYACGADSCLLGKGVMIDDRFPGIVDKILGSNSNYDRGGMPMSRTNQGASVVHGVVGQKPKATVPGN